MNDRIKETIVIIGFGWVGQANALALSFLGHSVFYYDTAEPVLRYGTERGRLYEKVLRLSHPLEKDGEHTWYLVCVGDRVDSEGLQNISFIETALSGLGKALGGVILRSTVLPEHLPKLRFDFYLPEFLHERHAVEECINPFLFVVGSREAGRSEPEFFKKWELRAAKVFRGSASEASYVKYLSNIWNAMRIAFVNEFGDIINKGGAGASSANRILDFLFEKKSYLRYGKAYGGHCLLKDTLAFWRSHAPEERAGLIRAIHDANEGHRLRSEHANLPEWFSRWEFTGHGARGAFSRFWTKFNAIPAVAKTRMFLRPMRRMLQRLAPHRTLSRSKWLWNRLGRKNPLFYSHPGTSSGRAVKEYAFRESGKDEYARFFYSDTTLKRLIGNCAEKEALDLGMGAGRHAEFLAGDFKQVFGVDISETMLSAARTRLSALHNIAFLETVGNRLPVPDASVDFVFSRETLESVSDTNIIAGYAAEMFRALSRGGVVKIELRTARSPYRWLYSHGCAFSPDEARALFENAGFRVHDVRLEGKHVWVTAQKP